MGMFVFGELALSLSHRSIAAWGRVVEVEVWLVVLVMVLVVVLVVWRWWE